MAVITRCLLVLLAGCSLYEGQDPPPPPSPLPPDGGPLPPPPDRPYDTLAVGPHDAMDIAVHGDYVYWLVNHQNSTGSAIFRVPKAGGARELVAKLDGIAYQFAVDDSYVYAPLYVQQAPGGALVRAPNDGTGTVETIDDGMRYLGFVAVDETYVYTAPLAGEMPVDYQLWRYPKAGGAHQVLVDGLDGPESIAFDATSLYVTSAGDSRLVKAPKNGGTGTEPLPGLYALHVVSDADNLYFLSGAIGECTDGRISEWPRTGTMLTDLGPSPTCASDLAVSSPWVYSVEPTGKIASFQTVGAVVRTELLTDLPSPSAIAVDPDGTRIYWVDFQTGEVNAYTVLVPL
jgi:hypothetical protein